MTTISQRLLDECVQRLRPVALNVNDLVVQHTVVDPVGHAVTHHQVFRAGGLQRWRLGVTAEAELRLTQIGCTSVFGPALPMRDAMPSITIQERRANGPIDYPLPPLDEVEMSSRNVQLPEVPGADVQVWFSLTDGPFGDLGFGIAFTSGRPRPWRGDGSAQEADVIASMPYDAYLAYRCGLVSVVDALGGQEPKGAWPHLMLSSGLTDGPEYRSARADVSAPDAALSAWRSFAQIVLADGYRTSLLSLGAVV